MLCVVSRSHFAKYALVTRTSLFFDVFPGYYTCMDKRFEWFVEFRLDWTTARIVSRKTEHRIIDISQARHWQTFWPTTLSRKTASCETSPLCYLARLFVRSSIKIARYFSCKNDESPSKIGKLFAPASRSRTPAAFDPPRKFNEVQTEQNESVVLRAGTFVRKWKGRFSARSAI